MRIVAVCLLSLSAVLAANAQAQPIKVNPGEPQPDQIKRLGSVTWDLSTHKLIWVVQKGTVTDGKFAPVFEQRYEVSPDEATMSVAEEKRGFGEDEALTLHHLLDVLSVYCAESVVWWEHGESDSLQENTVPAKPARPSEPSVKPAPKDEPKPIRVADPVPHRPGSSPVRLAAMIRPF
jgi:hypothetical protein